ncbi:alpha/beta hydrolase fold domain-containing protein [Saccharopolyspora elongata]|uniref:alpha/beta hydrolase fold domain-containing protein n=1 Tax=Saccharopolyspora elongata TaxID=2530387 RepID=UPI0022A7AD05|nr:alpha/beta hydrolase fold domain-containing protein [Saccharopolyspora elongata]
MIPGALTVGGQSSGANIAAGAAIALRDAGRADIRFELLEVPALDLSHSLHRPEGEDLPLRLADVRSFTRAYLTGPSDASQAWASPLLAPDLPGLPPTHVAVAEFDVLRVDGERYVERLRQAGVPAQLHLGTGHVHISPSMTRLLPSARA